MSAQGCPRPRQRFSKLDRVRKPREYSRIRREGSRRGGPGFTIVVGPERVGPARLGISVSRDVGNAVSRNRLRRLIREYFRTHREQFGDAHDVVVIPRPGVAWLRLRDLNEIGKLLRQVRSRATRRLP